MKKILLIMMLVLLTACSNAKEIKKEKPKDEKPKVEEKVEEYIDNNPLEVGLYYYNGGSNRELITTFYSSMPKFTDIALFETIPGREQIISANNSKYIWNDYWNNNGNQNYKIGYHIKFSLTNGDIIEKNILQPQDIESFFNYIQIYLYDDVHAPDGFYSHTTQEQYNENTILTSIKLTASVYIDEVNSPIELSTFTYDEDDFDENGNYRGNQEYKILIERK